MGYAYYKNVKGKLVRQGSENEADYIMIPMNEYNGLKKALRIINDRALQQIDKSKADEDGFRILRAGKSFYHEGRGQVYLVTKETPYSIKMELGDAWAIIEHTLRNKYEWLDQFNLEDYAPDIDDSSSLRISDSDYPALIKAWEDPQKRKLDYLVSNSRKGKALKNLMNEHSAMIISIAKVAANQAQGVYEVSYWCTQPI